MLLTDPDKRNFDDVESIERLARPFLFDCPSSPEPAASVVAAPEEIRRVSQVETCWQRERDSLTPKSHGLLALMLIG